MTTLSTNITTKHPIILYPNPTKDKIQFSELLKNTKLYDLNGRVLVDLKEPVEQLNITHLSSGNYFITSETLSNEKIVKFVSKN